MLNAPRSDWSKVITSVTPRRRHDAKWQSSRALKYGCSSRSCQANITSSCSNGQTSMPCPSINAIASFNARDLATGWYAWSNSCNTSDEVQSGVLSFCASTKNSAES